MKYKLQIVCVLTFLVVAGTAFCEDDPKSSGTATTPPYLSLDEIMAKVEQRYSGNAFSAKFDQKSTIKAMQITDTANGTVLIKRPGMMYWEYVAPEKQEIITDGTTIWAYRPEDNQVTTGKAPDYFGGGKGASFLSDIRLVRKQFDVTIYIKDNPDFYILKMIPLDKKYDVKEIFLSISKKNFDVARVATYNSYDDETLIDFSDYKFNLNPGDEKFRFAIPPGVDVLQMEE